MDKKNLEITTGSIADILSKIEELKTKMQENIDIESNNPDYTVEARGNKIKHWREFYSEKIARLKSGISEELYKIRAHVGEPFEFNPALGQEIDYLTTMHEAKALNSTMLKISADRYRGNEAALLYLRTKLKGNGISTAAFDELMFSYYEPDINGEMQFHSPAEYFEALSDTLAKSSARSSAIALSDLEKRLGIESRGLADLNEKLNEASASHRPGTRLDGGNTLI